MFRSSFIFLRPEKTRPYRDRKSSIWHINNSFCIYKLSELLLVIKLQWQTESHDCRLVSVWNNPGNEKCVFLWSESFSPTSHPLSFIHSFLSWWSFVFLMFFIFLLTASHAGVVSLWWLRWFVCLCWCLSVLTFTLAFNSCLTHLIGQIVGSQARE